MEECIVVLANYVPSVLILTPLALKWQNLVYLCHIPRILFLFQIIASEPSKVSMKLRVYISQLWNVLDTVGISLFIIGMVLRFVPATLRDAELIYCIDITLWQIRILEILSVNKYLGPYVKIMGKLVSYISFNLMVLLTVWDNKEQYFQVDLLIGICKLN